MGEMIECARTPEAFESFPKQPNRGKGSSLELLTVACVKVIDPFPKPGTLENCEVSHL